MRYAWLVCETTPRWTSAVRRFGPAALPLADDALTVTAAAAPQIRAIQSRASSAADTAVVLWVLQPPRIAETLAALSASAAATARHGSLHLAALDPTLTLRGGTAGRSARLALHEWQITAVLDTPEQLVTLLPLVRRHLTAIRPVHPPLDVLAELRLGDATSD